MTNDKPMEAKEHIVKVSKWQRATAIRKFYVTSRCHSLHRMVGRTSTTKDTNMKAAITELEIVLKTMETNEPINRKEGNTEQADIEAKNAAEIRQALAVLRAADAGPIWPAPRA